VDRSPLALGRLLCPGCSPSGAGAGRPGKLRATETVGDRARASAVLGPSRPTSRGRGGASVGVPSLCLTTSSFARAPPTCTALSQAANDHGCPDPTGVFLVLARNRRSPCSRQRAPAPRTEPTIAPRTAGAPRPCLDACCSTPTAARARTAAPELTIQVTRAPESETRRIPAGPARQRRPWIRPAAPCRETRTPRTCVLICTKSRPVYGLFTCSRDRPDTKSGRSL
jgi:hypothetical protein